MHIKFLEARGDDRLCSNTLPTCRYASLRKPKILHCSHCIYTSIRYRIHSARGSKPFNPIFFTLRTRLTTDPTASSFDYMPYAVYMC
jgi:hypothetical protein